MKLTGPQVKQLSDALVSAFCTRSELAQMMFYELGENLDAIAANTGLANTVFMVIAHWAEPKDKVVDLWRAARRANPGNAALRAITFLGDGTSSAMPTAGPAPRADTDYRGRPLHADHRDGVVRLVSEVLACDTDKAADVLARLFAPTFTYREVPNVTERAVVRAVDRAFGDDHNVPEHRIDEFVGALVMIAPERRVCPVCKCMDVVRSSGRWRRDDTDVCPRTPMHAGAAPGATIYRQVQFEARFLAWTDRTECEPGTPLDAARIPITDRAIAEHFAAGGLVVHRWVESLDRTAWCSHLLHDSGLFPPPHTMAAKLAVLRSLADPLTLFLDETALRVEQAKYLARRAPCG